MSMTTRELRKVRDTFTRDKVSFEDKDGELSDLIQKMIREIMELRVLYREACERRR